MEWWGGHAVQLKNDSVGPLGILNPTFTMVTLPCISQERTCLTLPTVFNQSLGNGPNTNVLKFQNPASGMVGQFHCGWTSVRHMSCASSSLQDVLE